MSIAIKLLLVALGVVLMEGFLIYLLSKKQARDRKKLHDAYRQLTSVNVDNIKKSKVLKDINKLREESRDAKTKISSADNSDIANLLNAQLSND